MLKVLTILTAILGILLCTGFFTDYSLPGTFADGYFMVCVSLVCLVSFIGAFAIGNFKEKRHYWNLLFFIPGLIGVVITVITVLDFAVSNFPFFFQYDEIKNERIIEKVVSPNGLKKAIVRFRGVGAYAGGEGRILITVQYKWVPLVERNVYYLNTTYLDENIRTRISWVDNRTLFLEETKETIPIGLIKFRIPLAIRIFLR